MERKAHTNSSSRRVAKRESHHGARPHLRKKQKSKMLFLNGSAKQRLLQSWARKPITRQKCSQWTVEDICNSHSGGVQKAQVERGVQTTSLCASSSSKRKLCSRTEQSKKTRWVVEDMECTTDERMHYLILESEEEALAATKILRDLIAQSTQTKNKDANSLCLQQLPCGTTFEDIENAFPGCLSILMMKKKQDAQYSATCEFASVDEVARILANTQNHRVKNVPIIVYCPNSQVQPPEPELQRSSDKEAIFNVLFSSDNERASECTNVPDVVEAEMHRIFVSQDEVKLPDDHQSSVKLNSQGDNSADVSTVIVQESESSLEQVCEALKLTCTTSEQNEKITALKVSADKLGGIILKQPEIQNSDVVVDKSTKITRTEREFDVNANKTSMETVCLHEEEKQTSLNQNSDHIPPPSNEKSPTKYGMSPKMRDVSVVLDQLSPKLLAVNDQLADTKKRSGQKSKTSRKEKDYNRIKCTGDSSSEDEGKQSSPSKTTKLVESKPVSVLVRRSTRLQFKMDCSSESTTSSPLKLGDNPKSGEKKPIYTATSCGDSSIDITDDEKSSDQCDEESDEDEDNELKAFFDLEAEECNRDTEEDDDDNDNISSLIHDSSKDSDSVVGGKRENL